MTKFKIGDRVAVYYTRWCSFECERETGIISLISDDAICFKSDRGDEDTPLRYAHAKQCRKLVKKKKYKNYFAVVNASIDELRKKFDRQEERFDKLRRGC